MRDDAKVKPFDLGKFKGKLKPSSSAGASFVFQATAIENASKSDQTSKPATRSRTKRKNPFSSDVVKGKIEDPRKVKKQKTVTTSKSMSQKIPKKQLKKKTIQSLSQPVVSKKKKKKKKSKKLQPSLGAWRF